MGPRGEVHPQVVVEAVDGRADLRRDEVGAGVGEDQHAAGRQGLLVAVEQRVRVGAVQDEVQQCAGDQRDRLGEVEQLLGLRRVENGLRLAEVGLQEGRPAVLVGAQQAAGVREHDRVVVGVDHAGVRRDLLSDLVGGVRGGEAGAEVEELADAEAGGVLHGAHEEAAVGTGADGAARQHRDDLVGDGAVGGEVVLAAQEVVVDPGRVRYLGAEFVGLGGGDDRVGHGC